MRVEYAVSNKKSKLDISILQVYSEMDAQRINTSFSHIDRENRNIP